MIEVVLERFLEEARELLGQGGQDLLVLERSADDAELVNRVFRAFHTMKGSSALFDFRPMTRALHGGEDLLQEVREARATLTAEKVDLLLAVLDLVGDWLDLLEAGAGLPLDADQVAEALMQRARDLGGAAVLAELAESMDIRASVSNTLPDWLGFSSTMPEFVGQSLIGIEYDPDPGCFFVGDDPLRLVSLVPNLLYLRFFDRPEVEQGLAADPFQCRLCFRIVAGCTLDEAQSLFTYVSDQVKLYEFSVGFGPDLELALKLLREMVQVLAETALPELAQARRNAQIRLALNVARAAGFPSSWQAELARAGELAQSAASDTPLRQALERLLEQAASAGRCGMRLSMLPQAVKRMSSIPAGRRRSLRASSPRLSLQAPIMEPLHPVSVQVVSDGTVKSAKPAPAAAKPPANRDASAGTQVYKVDQQRIDALLELAGELLVSKNALPYLSRRAETVFGSPALAREIKDQASVLTRIADNFHHAVMQLRIIPLSYVFDRFPRLVRDLSRQLDKNVRLEVIGESTEADKSTVEKLADPLIHIVRNSLDHGLETNEQRALTGKPREGTIRLQARHERGALVVTVSDDGRGIDPEKVRQTAVRRGVLTQDEVARLTDEESIYLIFRAGFSTKEVISDLSGRGVGMDVVKTAVDACGGKVRLQSRLGEGTELELTLPLSMAVTRVLLVEAEGRTFGVPFDLVLETLHVTASQIAEIRGLKAVTIRERVVPAIWLRELLQLPPADPERPPPEQLTLLLARIPAGDLAIVVDGFQEAVDVMVKPLEGPLATVRGYLGASLLGDGRALLILDLGALI